MSFLVALLFVYIMLFEFILPVNKVLPKPSLLLDSIIDVWFDYNLLEAAAITTFAVYISLFISFFSVIIFSKILLKISFELPTAIESFKIFRFFPAFFFVVLFSYWFDNSFLAEIFFAIISSILLASSTLMTLSKKINKTYVDVAVNLGLSKSAIYSKVIIKYIQPLFFEEYKKIHYYIWILVMIYEFVSNINGFGGIYLNALKFNDFTGLFAIAIIISLLIWFGNFVLNLINKKIFFWEE